MARSKGPRRNVLVTQSLVLLRWLRLCLAESAAKMAVADAAASEATAAVCVLSHKWLMETASAHEVMPLEEYLL